MNGQGRTRRSPPEWLSKYWWVVAAVGVALLVIGIVTKSQPAQRGGPIMLGVVCILGGLIGLKGKLRR